MQRQGQDSKAGGRALGGLVGNSSGHERFRAFRMSNKITKKKFLDLGNVVWKQEFRRLFQSQ